jgi:very-short-patch-repair endonuclease
VEATTGLGGDVLKRIEQTRRELLDLSARNRLINTPRGKVQGRKIEVVDERSDEVFRLLVRERKAMSFLPGAEEEKEEEDKSESKGENGAEDRADAPEALHLAQPDEANGSNGNGDGDGVLDPRHTDLRLQTRLTSERLQARLLDLYYDAQTFEQEQGVSTLYLALGFLKWYESDSSDKERHAPLLLVPVDLERASAASRFHLRYREADVTTNLSLQAKLKDEFGIDLPAVPEMDELAPGEYFSAVVQAVAGQPRWEVRADEMVLWFFSFAKYLMYRDLDPANWPEHAPLESNPTLSSLLGEGFVSEPPLCDETARIDPLIPPANMVHVTDADSSQAVVIEEVRRGRHLVVQGPPGTGKSQTITNLIATAVKAGKKVLFVAEKMAALEVVQGRLERLGLGSICFELHSHKANKKAVLEDLARTLALGRPKGHESDEPLERLGAAIARLNDHAALMNTPIDPAGLTPYQVIGRLRGLYDRGIEALDLGLTGLESWPAGRFREVGRAVEDLHAHLETIGPPTAHPWRGVNRTEPVLPPEFRELLVGLGQAVGALAAIVAAESQLARALGLPPRDDPHINGAWQLVNFAIGLSGSPPLDRTRIAGPAWDERAAEIARLVACGQTLAASGYRDQYRSLETLKDRLARLGPPEQHPFRGVRRTSPLDSSAMGGWSALLAETIEALGGVGDVARRLAESLRLAPRPDLGLKDIQQLGQLARRVVKAPRMDPNQVAHPAWEDARRDAILELVKQGQTLAAARAELKDRVAEIGWRTELAPARRNLAAYGRSFFRWFHRDYREAAATLRGILNDEPPAALSERLKLIDTLIAGQAACRTLEEDPTVVQLGGDAFGSDWKGSRSDWAHLGAIVAWDEDCRAARLPFRHRGVLAGLEQPEACRAPLDGLSTRLQRTFERLKALLAPLELDFNQAFGVDSIRSVPLPALVERLRQWQARPAALDDWLEYHAARQALDRAGLGAAALAIHEGRLTIDAAFEQLQRRFHQDLERAVGGPPAPGPDPGSSSSDESVFEGLGREAFGTQWNGIVSDWSALEAVVQWDRKCGEEGLAWNHRQYLARLESLEPVRDPLRELVDHLNPISGQLEALFQSVKLDVAEAFGHDDASLVPVRDLLARLRGWQDQPEGLSRWIGYQVRRGRLKGEGLGPLVDELHAGRLPLAAAVDQFHVAYYQALVRELFRRHADLAHFDGTSHGRWIEEFRALDKARIERARREVAAAHYDAMPRHATGGEMAVVRREIEKKRKHKPIRQLLKEAGTAILGIKPVFMMSPISVAQFLEPGSVTFDLLLIDEASQVSPVDALGAVARARQVVVVGDDKQLPPTRFFSKMLDNGAPLDGNDDDGLSAGDLESVLGLCLAQGMPQRMLRWHYRSRHHSLIAVSNREFYENHLYVVPSPTTVTALHGLHFRHVKGGVYDRGNSATNRVEAQAIADAVIEHARRYPRKSLGVGAFSVAQRDAIRDELELRQREHVELAGFFAAGNAEPFFVKNLENIQGDERDVIFISVGYAPDASGYMAMSFGPLSTQGGERRLNVLISRARERCEVFSSITADDIDLRRATSRGAAAFKTFLRYAATGVLDTQEPTGREHDSDFERQVDDALQARGYEVHRQVGTAGFIIDLAVVDPSRPGRYLLGIECDGATYHSSRSARDRDRLRETVLRDRGWNIHRVWSTDWFHRPAEQLEKLVAALERARNAADVDEQAEAEAEAEAETASAQAEPAVESEAPLADIDRAEPPELVGSTWAVPYVEAAVDVPSATPIHETSPAVLADIVARVVAAEGPIHREEIARRVTSLWGQQRTGARIAEAIARAVDAGIRSEVLQADDDFITHAQQAAVPVRNRSEVASPSLRKPEMIPPAEIRQAILHLVAEQVGISSDEIPPMVARALGFKATSTKLKDTIDEILERMVRQSLFELRAGKLFLP